MTIETICNLLLVRGMWWIIHLKSARLMQMT